MIVTDAVMVSAAWYATRRMQPGKASLVFFLILANPGLLLVDHIHFQYNGLLLGPPHPAFPLPPFPSQPLGHDSLLRCTSSFVLCHQCAQLLSLVTSLLTLTGFSGRAMDTSGAPGTALHAFEAIGAPWARGVFLCLLRNCALSGEVSKTVQATLRMR